MGIAPPSRQPFSREKPRLTPLPTFTSAVEEKQRLTSFWSSPNYVRGRRLPRWPPWLLGILGRKRSSAMFLLTIAAFFWLIFPFGSSNEGGGGDYEAPTLVFRRRELQRIWLWELASGHYPSSRKIPSEIQLSEAPLNPGIPEKGLGSLPRRFRPPAARTAEAFTPVFAGATIGTGPKRTYADIPINPKFALWPSRPHPDSIADLDVVMEHCDFDQHKFVRDCLEVLRAGAGLDVGTRVRRGNMDTWRYIYREENTTTTWPTPTPRPAPIMSNPDKGLVLRKDVELEGTLKLPPPVPPVKSTSICDPDHPHIFHMFWTGPFTDKPYMLLLSFLFTQNLGLHTDVDSTMCRPQFWLWIKLDSAVSDTAPTALADMFDTLASNPWSAPFLHKRFKDIIKFKLWNTAEQLDNIAEIKDEWREFKDRLFNAGGYVYSIPKEDLTSTTSDTDEEIAQTSTIGASSPTSLPKKGENNLFDRVGSKSPTEYDRLSVVLSDMARFVLCHRFGGIYVDADTIFLRDWTELWNWKGAFAYRWSRLPKYNTAVLKLNKGSALGSFLFRTALKNGLDFHPMTVSTYTKDAYLESLLLRLPDALFDPAWLNTEWYQRARPPMPYFTDFQDFFQTPQVDAAAPQAAGFDHFFRGAFSYHFHNQWWTPFDRSRNWPELGPKFKAGEMAARAKLELKSQGVGEIPVDPIESREDQVADDTVDLPWTAVLKRTFEAFIRGERPNMYGEWFTW